MSTSTPQEKAGGVPPGQSKLNRLTSAGCGIAFGLMVAASVVASYVQPPPTVAAQKYLTEQGVAADNLRLAGYEDHGFIPALPFPQHATVEFWVDGTAPSRKLVVEMSRTMYFLPWHATAFQEKVEK